MATVLEPLMAEGGSLIIMSYLGAERVVRNYGVMEIIKTALESDAIRAPLGRTVTIEEVGALVGFLCSSGSSGMTGQTIYVDAGAHIVA